MKAYPVELIITEKPTNVEGAPLQIQSVESAKPHNDSEDFTGVYLHVISSIDTRRRSVYVLLSFDDRGKLEVFFPQGEPSADVTKHIRKYLKRCFRPMVQQNRIVGPYIGGLLEQHEEYSRRSVAHSNGKHNGETHEENGDE